MQFLIRTIPAPQNPSAAQARITALCGVNEFGEPLMRLEWGGTAERWLAGAWRAKYRLPGVKAQTMLAGWTERQGVGGQQIFHPASMKAPKPQPGNLLLPIVEKHEFTDPFWYLAEWIPPEKMGDTPEQWEARRWELDRNGKRVDMIGPFPERGQYRPILRFAGPQGEFIACDDPRVFKTCEALWFLHQQMAATKGYWRDFMQPHEVEQVGRDILDGILADHADNYAQLREEIASEVAPHAHRILNNSRVFLN